MKEEETDKEKRGKRQTERIRKRGGGNLDAERICIEKERRKGSERKKMREEM